jgi:predicted amidohydrolase
MSARPLHVAATQMDVAPAPLAERLARAERLSEQASEGGAQLVVLPELFGVGYAYQEQNFGRAEPADGPTAMWMRSTAARLGVYLAGSILLAEGGEIYNTMLLVAPSGRTWRYDKSFPWGWERAYFRPGRTGPVVADTELGRLGMLVCWDVAHPKLWRAYAGRVDAVIVSSCPPDVGKIELEPARSGRVALAATSPVLARERDSAAAVFGAMIAEQAAWLGVPAVNTVGCGLVQTPIPNVIGTLLSFAPVAPQLLAYLRGARALRMRCSMTEACMIVDARGRQLAGLRQSAGEGFVSAQVMPSTDQQARLAQPRGRASLLARLSSDTILPALVTPVYRRGLRTLRRRST